MPKRENLERRKRLSAKWIMLLIGVMSLTQAMAATTPAERVMEKDRPLVIAHRGYPAIAPENTLPAFALGKLMGADMVELDYHVTRDGVAVVIHDATLDRTTDSVAQWGQEEVRLEDKSALEVSHLDAGSWYDPRYAGTKLPTLEEALNLIQADGGMCLIERKGGAPAHIVEFLKDRKLINQVVLQSFDWDYLKEVHALQPDQVLWALGPQKYWEGEKLEKEDRELSPEWIDRALETGARLVVWNQQVNEEALEYAHGKGIKIVVYTVNELEPAQQFLEAGVDGLITNNAGLIWKAMATLKE